MKAPDKGVWYRVALAYRDDEDQQFTAGGQLLPPARAVLESPKFIARFLSNLETVAAPDTVDADLGPCQVWKRHTDRGGYGQIKLPAADTGVWLTLRAYRVAFLLHHKRWNAPGTILLHACDNPACCAPLHLREGTYSENNQEAWDRGRQPRERKKPFGTKKWRPSSPSPKMLSGGSPVSATEAERAVAAISGSDDPEGEALLLALDLGVKARTILEIGRQRRHVASRRAARAQA